MKNLVKIIAFVIVLSTLSFISGTACAYDETYVTGVIIDPDPETNVRNGPSTSYSILGTVKHGEQVTVVGKRNSWYKVKYQLGYGYMYQNLIELNYSTGVIIDPDPETNVRSGPSTSDSILGTVKHGEQVTIIGTSGSWSKVFFEEEIGFIYSDLISTSSDSASGSDKASGSSSENTNNSGSSRFDAVGTASKSATRIVVDKSTHLLSLYSGSGELLLQCSCSTAKAGYSTPSGEYRVTIVSSRDYTRTSESGTVRTYGADDPINPFYIYVKCVNVKTGRVQYLHGTGGWLLIGGDYSNGCIRIADGNLRKLITYLPCSNSTNSTNKVYIEADSCTLIVE